MRLVSTIGETVMPWRFSCCILYLKVWYGMERFREISSRLRGPFLEMKGAICDRNSLGRYLPVASDFINRPCLCENCVRIFCSLGNSSCLLKYTINFTFVILITTVMAVPGDSIDETRGPDEQHPALLSCSKSI